MSHETSAIVRRLSCVLVLNLMTLSTPLGYRFHASSPGRRARCDLEKIFNGPRANIRFEVHQFRIKISFPIALRTIIKTNAVVILASYALFLFKFLSRIGFTLGLGDTQTISWRDVHYESPFNSVLNPEPELRRNERETPIAGILLPA